MMATGFDHRDRFAVPQKTLSSRLFQGSGGVRVPPLGRRLRAEGRRCAEKKKKQKNGDDGGGCEAAPRGKVRSKVAAPDHAPSVGRSRCGRRAASAAHNLFTAVAPVTVVGTWSRHVSVVRASTWSAVLDRVSPWCHRGAARVLVVGLFFPTRRRVYAKST